MYYKYSDRVIKTIRKRLIDIFVTAKSKLPIDEINEAQVVTYSMSMYKEIEDLCKMYFQKVAKAEYNRIVREDDWMDDYLVEKFIDSFTNTPSPITGYKFDSEMDRKKYRFIEGVVAGKEDTFKTSMNSLSRMIYQEMIEVVDASAIEAYRASGVTKVMWHTSKDEKVCDECEPLDGMIFRLDEVPVKSHINCRCYITPVK